MARSGLVVLLSALLGVITLIVLVGVIYPVVARLWGQSLSIGAPYFNATIVPLALPILVLMAVVPVLKWQA
ncbi:cytochrome c-type biogenesis CcmF C-terminal domain-containing protein, partial [Acinetobacter baumannii]